jgi:hypothetical protein
MRYTATVSFSRSWKAGRRVGTAAIDRLVLISEFSVAVLRLNSRLEEGVSQWLVTFWVRAYTADGSSS